MIRNKILFLVVSAVHLLIAVGSFLLVFAWTMSILDDSNPQDIVPWGLQVVGWISAMFTAPIFLMFGHQIISFPSIWIVSSTLLLNSIVVCYLLVFIWEKFRGHYFYFSGFVAILVIIASGFSYNPQKPRVFTPATTTEQTIVQLKSKKTTNQTAMRIEVLSLISQNKNVLPVVRYRLDGTKSSGYIHLIDKSFGESIWGMEEVSGTHDLDLNTLTRQGSYDAIIVPDGDYFLRFSAKFSNNTPSDTLVACTGSDCSTDSAVFHIAPGITTQTPQL